MSPLETRSLRRIDGGSILILHDASATLPLFTRMQTYRALEEILTATRARGLRAVTVAELRSAA